MISAIIKMIYNFLGKIGSMWGKPAILVQPTETKPVNHITTKPVVRPPVPPMPVKTRVERREYTRQIESPQSRNDNVVDDLITIAAVSAVIDLFSSPNSSTDQPIVSGGGGDFGGGGASGSWSDDSSSSDSSSSSSD